MREIGKRVLDGLEGKVLEPLVGGGGSVGFVLGPHGAGVDPGFDRGDLRGRERIAFGRHAFVFVAGRDAGEEAALRAVARDDAGTVFAAVEGVGLRIQTEVGSLFFGPVALDAALLQHRPDFLVEINGGTDSQRQCQDD